MCQKIQELFDLCAKKFFAEFDLCAEKFFDNSIYVPKSFWRIRFMCQKVFFEIRFMCQTILKTLEDDKCKKIPELLNLQTNNLPPQFLKTHVFASFSQISKFCRFNAYRTYFWKKL